MKIENKLKIMKFSLLPCGLKHTPFIFYFFIFILNPSMCPGPMAAIFKAYCFELMLQDATLVQSRGEQFSDSVWDLCQHSIIPVYKANNDWGLDVDGRTILQ